jgi:hypothetical protein
LNGIAKAEQIAFRNSAEVFRFIADSTVWRFFHYFPHYSFTLFRCLFSRSRAAVGPRAMGNIVSTESLGRGKKNKIKKHPQHALNFGFF